jgi:ketosteroid isomerase-like protein
MKLKSGRTYSNYHHFLFKLRGSKISVYHEHFDSAHVNEAIGLNALEAEKTGRAGAA